MMRTKVLAARTARGVGEVEVQEFSPNFLDILKQNFLSEH